MDDLKFRIRVDATKYVVILLGCGTLATLLGGSASRGRLFALAPMPPSSWFGLTPITIEWALCAVFAVASAYAYYKLSYDNSSEKFVHLTNSSITIPLSSGGQTVSIPYRSIERVEIAWTYYAGRRINIWHKEGAFVISSQLLLEDELDKIYDHIRRHVDA